MTGERIYNLHREYVAAITSQSIPAWETLDADSRTRWEIAAYEQRLRDRAEGASLPGDRGKDISYDGSYAD